MRSWSIRDARARFGEVLEACLEEGPQIVTRRGTEVAVLVPVGEWRRMNGAVRPTLKELLLAPAARVTLPVRRRGRLRRRLSAEVG